MILTLIKSKEQKLSKTKIDFKLPLKSESLSDCTTLKVYVCTLFTKSWIMDGDV